jgi:CxxC motif-containing protein
MEKHMVCISCPVGCRLTVRENESAQIIVSGNLCHRGDTYGKEEFANPKRIVTAIVKTDSHIVPYVPVKTNKALAKEMIPSLLDTLYSMSAKTPIRLGDIVIGNYKGQGVDIVFTRTVEK